MKTLSEPRYSPEGLKRERELRVWPDGNIRACVITVSGKGQVRYLPGEVLTNTVVQYPKPNADCEMTFRTIEEVRRYLADVLAENRRIFSDRSIGISPMNLGTNRECKGIIWRDAQDDKVRKILEGLAA